MLAARTTPLGTRRFAARFPDAAAGHFRDAQGWTVASIGLGTYLGKNDDATDAGYARAVSAAVQLGSNVLDTAINYRDQRSERVIGHALSGLVAEGKIRRDEIVVCTKGGFLPSSSGHPGGMRRYVEDTFLRTGVIAPSDIVAGCHCMTPAYLRHQLEASRHNLHGIGIDIYYLHNPETQLQEVDRATFGGRLRAAFEVFEEAVAQGTIQLYGTATWNGFRADPFDAEYLSLDELLRCARDVAGDAHHFRAIQLPFNLAMTEAFLLPNQRLGGKEVPVIRAAAESGVSVFASASLLQARLAHSLPEPIRAAVDGGLRSDGQRALQFVRSTPGVATALVGMSNHAHVSENLGLLSIPPLPGNRFATTAGG